MRQSVPVEEAVGMVLPHDISEIVKDVKKVAAFKKGHVIRAEDIPHLRRLGKDHIFALSLGEDEIHENEAAEILARALAGVGVEYDALPQEGKVTLRAARDGLLRIDREKLLRLNLLGEVMCATLHDNTPVKRGDHVAATRLIPLIAPRSLLREAEEILAAGTPVVEVHTLRRVRFGLVITGNEVYYGRIRDQFEEVLRQKVAAIGSELLVVRRAPDDQGHIAREITACIADGAELVVTSGGMSVDPDDVTREAILQAGAVEVVYGTPVLPGAMFLVGRIGAVPVIGLPACGMYHKITVFDLVLPRILTGQKIGREEIAALGHGGLCRNCGNCHYPVCPFGK
jgi:hypothetical protein